LPQVSFRRLLPLCALTLLVGGCADMPQGYSTTAAPGFNQDTAYHRPSLVVTDAPAPVNGDSGGQDHASPAPAPASTASGTSAPVPLVPPPAMASQQTMAEPMPAPPPVQAAAPAEAPVSQRVENLDRDLGALQSDTFALQDRLTALQGKSDIDAARYFDIVSSITTALQGNAVGAPALVEKENLARARLDDISQSADALKGLAADAAAAAARAGRLQENIHAAGSADALPQDQGRLRTMEDGVDHQVAQLTGLQGGINDENARREAYLRNERLHMQTLSLAIGSRGHAGETPAAAATANPPAPPPESVPQMHHRPLIVIRFNRPDVNYEDALYSSVSQALQKYPSATFEIVAISSGQGGPARTAAASSDARRQGEAVLRSLTQMGMPLERLTLSAATGTEAKSSEVHVYLQ